ncbi:MAG: hypothetical protein K1X48_03385 [Burkholderiaceae bacterium]|nr:hypothetical protein [Burkholderiaceae bacterium]
MEFKDLVQKLCKQPGMWVSEPYFMSVCAYLRGYDDAREGGPLAGFREWLIVKVNEGNNLGWERLVQNIIFRDELSQASLKAQGEEESLLKLASLLDEYLVFRSVTGLTKVYYDYAQWLLKKQWYSGPLGAKQNQAG